MRGLGFWQFRAAGLAIVGAALCCVQAAAETLESALAQAYNNNPQLNAQRALVRATDENVPTALAGYRPTIRATAVAGPQSLSTTTREIGSLTPINSPTSTFLNTGMKLRRGARATITPT